MIDEKARLAAYNKYAELTGHLNTPSLDDALEAYEAAKQKSMGDGSATIAPVSAETVPPITPAKQQPSAPVGDDVEHESNGEVLQRLGMDGSLWAEEFCSTAQRLYPGNPMIDKSWMLAWFCNAIMAGYDEAERRHRAVTAAGTAPFDQISIDVSTGERDANLRAFADMPPVDIMNDKGRRIALFIGELNNDMPNNTALIRQLVDGLEVIKAHGTSELCQYSGGESARYASVRTMRDIAEKTLSAYQAYLQQQDGK